jgi:ATP-binding cassette subfamily B (MDR/TAP) protein 1
MEQGEQTILVIAHRLSTIRGADVIAVVTDGKVVETGSHEELLARKGAYFGLVNAQKGNPKEEDGMSSDVESDSDAQPIVNPNEESVEISHFEASRPGDSTLIKPAIELKNVHFWYPSRPGNKIFSGLNLAVKEGETMAVVGPSGQGKSTIFQLIEQFYRPTDGTIEYQGVDMKELNIQWIRDQISLVSQEPVLFDTTLAENIRFGTSATDQEIEEAARKANAHDFISAFPDGYSTQVGAGSSLQVSGGQKQR